MTEPVELSQTGAQRREAMLDVLHGAMRERVRRRRVVRAGAAVLLVAGAGIAAAAWWPRTVLPSAPGPIAAEAPAMRNASLRIVQTGAVAPAAMIKPIDDNELLTELRALGHPTGMIRTHDRVTLTADLRVEAEKESGGAG